MKRSACMMIRGIKYLVKFTKRTICFLSQISPQHLTSTARLTGTWIESGSMKKNRKEREEAEERSNLLPKDNEEIIKNFKEETLRMKKNKTSARDIIKQLKHLNNWTKKSSSKTALPSDLK